MFERDYNYKFEYNAVTSNRNGTVRFVETNRQVSYSSIMDTTLCRLGKLKKASAG